MKNLLLVIFLFFSTFASAQVVDNNDPDTDTFDIETVPFRYPYYGIRVPPFMGVVAGYEGFHNHCWEAGLVFNIADIYSETSKTGEILGFTLSYKHSLSNPLNAIEAEVGYYSPITIGFGFNENFYNGTRTFGFRPFLGTSWYHFQVMAGYNFYSKKQNDIAELDHFTVKVRYVLPVVRIFKRTTGNPGNNY